MSKFRFKCRFCHGYGHFARNCKKKYEKENVKEKEDQWTQVQKTGKSGQGFKKKGKSIIGDFVAGTASQAGEILKGDHNSFDVLNSSETILEEGELSNMEVIEPVLEDISVLKDLSGPSFVALPPEGGSFPSSPINSCSPPSYAEIARKKNDVSPNSSEDYSFELKKTVGRKSKNEIREEEAERLKTQGSQATIEMSYGRNERNRPPKGVITPSSLGK